MKFFIFHVVSYQSKQLKEVWRYSEIVDFLQFFLVWDGSEYAGCVPTLYSHPNPLKQIAGRLLLSSDVFDSLSQLLNKLEAQLSPWPHGLSCHRNEVVVSCQIFIFCQLVFLSLLSWFSCLHWIALCMTPCQGIRAGEVPHQCFALFPGEQRHSIWSLVVWVWQSQRLQNWWHVCTGQSSLDYVVWLGVSWGSSFRVAAAQTMTTWQIHKIAAWACVWLAYLWT